MPNEYTLGGPPPQSRSEKILMKQNPGPAQSRIEELLKNASAGCTAGVLVYKGTVETALSLPASGNEVGDVYHVNSDGSEWAWNGEQWEELGTTVDLSGKQDKIPDLETIRSNAAAGAAKISCTEATVSGYGFTKNTGTYSKPSGGIPASDLASDVQTSLGKADTALQQHQSLSAYRTASAQDTIDAAQDSAIAAKYTKPSGGIPKTDLASAVQTSLGKADTALQQHQSLTGYATETWVEGKGYQTAQDVQTAINGVRQLPTGGSTGDFLRKDAQGNAAWETVPSAEGASF